MAILSVDEVRDYVTDYPEANLLLDNEQFSNSFIQLCMSLAVDEFNNMPPRSGWTLDTFTFKNILLQGTLWQMFQGKSALAARNTLSYTDGGLQVPVEEKYELYSALAATHKAIFTDSASRLKIHLNMESGWGSVISDESMFPIW